MSNNLNLQEDSTATSMPVNIPKFLSGWLDTPLGYLAIIAVTALVFAIGGVLEFEYSLDTDADDLFVYSLILSAIFAVGISVLMYGISLITPQVSMKTIMAVIGINTLIYLIIAIIKSDELFFAHSSVTSLVMGFESGTDTLMTNIWLVRIIQSALFALVISELNTIFRAPEETRLNIGLTIAVFIGLVILSWGYVELMAGAVPSFFEQDEFRLKLAGSGSVYGGAVAALLLFAYKIAYKSNRSTA